MAIPPGTDERVQDQDHPLSDGPESAWSIFFKDNEVLLQIDKDVRRLCPDISFFQQVGAKNKHCFRQLARTSLYYFSGYRISM